MTKLIINADDFGYSRAINYGILDAHLEGIVTSTTMMANMPGLVHAVQLSKELPSLGIGVHLSLTSGRPVREDVETLVDRNGSFLPLSFYREQSGSIDLEQLYSEWQAQIDRLLGLGIPLTHIDSHHYTHAFPAHREVAEELGRHYQLPLRNCLDAKIQSLTPELYPADAFWNLFNFPLMKDMSLEYPNGKEELFSRFTIDAAAHRHLSVVEASCHPGYLDETVWYGSSFNLARMKEISVLQDPSLSHLLREYGYELIHYGHLVR